jgi:hypothetical protein
VHKDFWAGKVTPWISAAKRKQKKNWAKLNSGFEHHLHFSKLTSRMGRNRKLKFRHFSCAFRASWNTIPPCSHAPSSTQLWFTPCADLLPSADFNTPSADLLPRAYSQALTYSDLPYTKIFPRYNLEHEFVHPKLGNGQPRSQQTTHIQSKQTNGWKQPICFACQSTSLCSIQQRL